MYVHGSAAGRCFCCGDGAVIIAQRTTKQYKEKIVDFFPSCIRCFYSFFKIAYFVLLYVCVFACVCCVSNVYLRGAKGEKKDKKKEWKVCICASTVFIRVYLCIRIFFELLEPTFSAAICCSLYG